MLGLPFGRQAVIARRVLPLMIVCAGLAHANLLPVTGPYTVTACGGSGQVSCGFTPGGHTPTAADLQGLTNALFTSYFDARIPSLLGFPNPTFSWTALAASADGFVIGSVNGPDAINTQFVYRNGQLYCCITDSPFTIMGINDSDEIVGFDPYTTSSFLAMATDNETTFGTGGLTFTDPTFNPFQFGYRFIGIDNRGDILAQNYLSGQDYLLAATPEPGSILSLGTVLLAVGLIGRARLRRNS